MLVLLQVKLLRQGERTLELLALDETKYSDEMTAAQEAFAEQVAGLTAVSAIIVLIYSMQVWQVLITSSLNWWRHFLHTHPCPYQLF